jgi:hypothetical protein
MSAVLKEVLNANRQYSASFGDKANLALPVARDRSPHRSRRSALGRATKEAVIARALHDPAMPAHAAQEPLQGSRQAATADICECHLAHCRNRLNAARIPLSLDRSGGIARGVKPYPPVLN